MYHLCVQFDSHVSRTLTIIAAFSNTTASVIVPEGGKEEKGRRPFFMLQTEHMFGIIVLRTGSRLLQIETQIEIVRALEGIPCSTKIRN